MKLRWVSFLLTAHFTGFSLQNKANTHLSHTCYNLSEAETANQRLRGVYKCLLHTALLKFQESRHTACRISLAEKYPSETNRGLGKKKKLRRAEHQILFCKNSFNSDCFPTNHLKLMTCSGSWGVPHWDTKIHNFLTTKEPRKSWVVYEF